MAKCKKCNTDKSDDEFYYRKDGRISSYTCKSCTIERTAEYRKDRPEKTREWYRKNKLKQYGLTPDEYQELYDKQNGLCAICTKECPQQELLCVDHCHKAGDVRGLLCKTCNSAIGFLNDDPELVRSALFYLLNKQTLLK
jgi:hypothetical protein